MGGGEEIRSVVKYYRCPQEGRHWIGPMAGGEDPHRAKNVSFKRSPRRGQPGNANNRAGARRVNTLHYQKGCERTVTLLPEFLQFKQDQMTGAVACEKRGSLTTWAQSSEDLYNRNDSKTQTQESGKIALKGKCNEWTTGGISLYPFPY